MTTLTQEQLAEFHKTGALVVPGALDAGWLRRVRAEYEARAEYLLARLGLSAAGGFDEKMSRLIVSRPESYEHLDISLPMISDMASRARDWEKLFGEKWREEAGIFAPNSVMELLAHPNIVAIAKQTLGETSVAASPVQHARIKPPQRLLPEAAAGDANMSRTLWHQDEAVVTEDARGVEILTVWAAVTEATLENGCMFAVAGSHLAEDSENAPDFGLTTHCPGKKLAAEIYIPDSLVKSGKVIPLIAKPGDIVLLNKRTIHGAGENRSRGLRWSFDLRYQKAGTPSGRECFPSAPVAGEGALTAADAEYYRESWLRARDKIIAGEIPAVFNDRWNKYHSAQICA